MRNATKKFRDSNSLLNLEINITLEDGTQLLATNDNIMMGGLTTKDATSSENTFDIGYCACREMTVKLDNSGDIYSAYDFSNARLFVKASKTFDNTTETIPFGYYYVDSPEYSGAIISLACVDYMFLLNENITGGVANGSAQSIVNAICNKFGIVLATQRFAGYQTQITLPSDLSKLTYRELLGYICQCTCNYARINDYGQLNIDWYDTNAFDLVEAIDGSDFSTSSGDVVDGGDFVTYDVSNSYDAGAFSDRAINHHFSKNSSETINTDDVVITGLKVKNENSESMYGEDGYVLVVQDNPLTIGREEEFAKQIGTRCIGMRFRPFNVTTASNLLVEAGDTCYVTDRKGRTVQSYVTSNTWSIGSGQNITCNAESAAFNSADKFSVVTKSIIEARKATKYELTAYDAAVQQLTNLMTNAFGVFKSSEEQADGSIIYYMHNKPNRAESTTIWKMTADAFAVSTDGGKTYSAGLDSSGNAVLNVLNAIGINADWINAGTLTGRAINNGSGTFTVDEKGNVVANSLKSNNAEITGGTINIETAESSKSAITLRASATMPNGQVKQYLIYISPSGIKCSSTDGEYSYNLAGVNLYNSSTGKIAILSPNILQIQNDASDINQGYVQVYPDAIRAPSAASLYVPESTVTCNSLLQLSDARLKTDKNDISENELKILDLVRLYSFKFKKDDSKRRWGVYAQELLELLKECELGDIGIVEKGLNGYYAVDYISFIPLLLKDRQVQKSTIESMQIEIELLKDRVSKLEGSC